MTKIVHLVHNRRNPMATFFSRSELSQLLSLYSRQVMRGEWRDYAIDQRDGAAVFSVYRHSQEGPLYTIVKTAPTAGKCGDFAVLQGRHRLASGVLDEVLANLRGKLGAVLAPSGGSAGC